MDNSRKLTTISVTYENYLAQKDLGKTGDSFNDVVTMLLKEHKA
jgi:predicted CopG family antitoxin